MLASRKQTIRVGADAEAGPFVVTSKNRFDRYLQFLGVTIVGHGWLLLRGKKIIVDCNNVPERCIDRIELRLLASIGKTIRQHALRNSARPLQQNVACFFEMTSRDAEPAQRDKRVASPIAEPWVAGDERFSVAAFYQIRVGGAFERTGEIISAGLLDRPDLSMTRFD